MSTRVDIDVPSVLEAFVGQIRGGVTLISGGQFTDKTCFVSYYPEPYTFPDTTFVTVAPGRTRFPEEFQIGGGQHQLTEEMEILVTIWSRHTPNQIGHDATGLNDPERGVYPIRQKILRALVAADLDWNYPPGSSGQNTFLRQLVLAVSCDPPEHVGLSTGQGTGNIYVKLGMRFKAMYDLDLLS